MIDSRGTVDRDDAIAVRPLDDGWELMVYVADVASGVALGSAADQEAFRRRESAYGGWRGTAKMLPRPVEDRLTLAEDRPCATMRVRLDVTSDGIVRHTDVARAAMSGAMAVHHQEVAAATRDPEHPLHSGLREAAALSEVLLARRRDQGALALYDLLSGWATDEDGAVVRLAAFERNIGYKVVQECMIAANTALAAWAAERDLPVLFRNHSAARVSPPRSELLEDLDLAFADGSPARLEALQQRTLMTMKAAEYAPYMGGHWGLNLPGYVHATSPLRRYADLVVQRIIFSHLDNSASPYGEDELSSVAGALNDGARADRQAQQESFKSSAHTRARRAAAAAAADYSALDSKAFHAVLKRGCKDNIAGPSLVEETGRRAAAQQLTSLELQLVLLVADGTGWEVARTACLAAIAAAPETAISVLSVHAQVNDLPLPRFADGSTGQAPHTVFSAQASWTAADGEVRGSTRSASAKKAARHQAAVSLLARLAELPDPSKDLAEPAPEALTATRGPAPTVTDVRSPLSMLNEYAQIRVISGLEYSVTGEGPDHLPTFTCTAHAVCEGRSLAGESSAASKAAAKTAAADSLLAQVHEVRASTNADTSVNSGSQR
ncbi:RNB domain-containing ribonuclease [Streptomyces sp. NBC_00582]|uniref:RNB domain-containing ribonuclease n=1 Tax=Streptomyces sp. NBC_00582 TaxID=2975783 RepID=UPI002E8215B2|nr:RNB domain-containing ribonuclease [Streptomyces sp. NBC_00582]WUB68318.1 RNB domain-containing ribonuclease [Streptomyces sp. NBC_00582]